MQPEIKSNHFSLNSEEMYGCLGLDITCACQDWLNNKQSTFVKRAMFGNCYVFCGYYETKEKEKILRLSINSTKLKVYSHCYYNIQTKLWEFEIFKDISEVAQEFTAIIQFVPKFMKQFEKDLGVK